MGKPTTNYDWATDATYDADAAANKTEPPAVLRSNGLERGEEPGAQHLNYHLAVIQEWFDYIDGVIDGTVDTDGVVRTPEFGGAQFHFASDWDIDNAVSGGYGINSEANTGLAVLPLNRLLPNGAVVTEVEVLWKPGASRTGASRMQLALQERTLTWGGSPVAGAPSTTGSTYDAGSTTALHESSITSLSVTISSAKQQQLLLVAGNDGGTNKDVLHAVRITYTDVRAA